MQTNTHQKVITLDKRSTFSRLMAVFCFYQGGSWYIRASLISIKQYVKYRKQTAISCNSISYMLTYKWLMSFSLQHVMCRHLLGTAHETNLCDSSTNDNFFHLSTNTPGDRTFIRSFSKRLQFTLYGNFSRNVCQYILHKITICFYNTNKTAIPSDTYS